MFLLVVAKTPAPGRVKTRLSPPCTAEEAAAIAEAALADTLDAATSSGADEVILALEGQPGRWLPEGVHVVPQGEGTFDHRLDRIWAVAHTRCGTPGLQIGMDTPQVTASDLDAAMATLAAGDHDAVLGMAADGGWWAIGMLEARQRTFTGIPMSRADTGARQLERLHSFGLSVGLLAEQRDVDHFDDAVAVAATAPDGRFSATVRAIEAEVRAERTR